jgi:hypothetical protein
MVIAGERTEQGETWLGAVPRDPNLPEATGTVGEFDLFVVPLGSAPLSDTGTGLDFPERLYRQWFRMRDEYIWAGEVEGVPAFVKRKFVDGKFWAQGASRAPKYGMKVGANIRLMVDNFEIRELVRAPE